MATSYALANALHVLAAVVWVGGMFFAYMALRPVAASLLETPLRVTLWRDVFRRFFLWVWLAVVLILITGFWIILGVYGGFGAVRPFVHTMTLLGLIMMAIFMHVYFAPYGRMKKAIAAQDWPEAGRRLGQIRRLVGINTILGLLTVVVGAGGRLMG